MRKVLISIFFLSLVPLGSSFSQTSSIAVAMNSVNEFYSESSWGHQPAKVTKDTVYRENPHLLEADQKKEEDAELEEIREHEED
jgi:hypothetical protein